MNLQGRPRNPHFTNGETEAQRIGGNSSKVTWLENEGNGFCKFCKAIFFSEQPQRLLGKRWFPGREGGVGVLPSPSDSLIRGVFRSPSALAGPCSEFKLYRPG